MHITDLAHLNVILNATTATLLLVGLGAIKRGHPTLHKRVMTTALCTGAAFFVSYGIYHFNIGSKKYEGPTPLLYYIILTTHVILAAVNLPLVIITAKRAFAGNIAKHRRIARITWPLWMYVSITGVIVYFMLY